MRAPPSSRHLTPSNSQRSHFQIPPHWGLRLQQTNLGEGHKHFICNTWQSLKKCYSPFMCPGKMFMPIFQWNLEDLEISLWMKKRDKRIETSLRNMNHRQGEKKSHSPSGYELHRRVRSERTGLTSPQDQELESVFLASWPWSFGSGNYGDGNGETTCFRDCGSVTISHTGGWRGLVVEKNPTTQHLQSALCPLGASVALGDSKKATLTRLSFWKCGSTLR